MKILLLSEDSSIFDDNNPSRAKILEYASLVNMLFVIVATSFKKNSNKAKQITENIWAYKTNSTYKFLQIYNIFKLASFEMNIKGIFQAELIICEDLFYNALAGYILAKKFKRPLCIFFSETNEKIFFNPIGLKNILLTKILFFVINKADYIKVNNFSTREKLLKKSSSLKVEVIQPFIDVNALLAVSNKIISEEKINGNLIRKKFPQFRFTAVTFVNNIEQIKISLEVFKNLNRHFPPTSLILLYSNNLTKKGIDHIIKKDFEPFIHVEALGDNLCEYLISSNVFFGISSGEKYEEVLSKAYIVGAKIIAKESDISKKLINDNTTGFICPISDKQETLNYFVNKTLLLINNPVIGIRFKINRPINFQEQFSVTKEEYENKLKLSMEKCLEEYKKTKIKYYNF